ncbi:MAG: amidohydrolase family protein [Planctomycetota bacterium]|nr:amidohydrolase family protein [Planctomycetota bacterium]
MSFPIFDIHCLFGDSLFEKSESAASMQTRRDQYPELEALLIPAKPKDYLYPGAMEELRVATKSLAATFPCLRVDPWRSKEAEELIEQSREPAVFLHPFEEHMYPTHKNFYSVVEHAAKKKRPVIIASGYLPYSHAAQILPLIRDFPEHPFILTHGAQINICGLHITEAFEIFESCPNTYFETSGIYRQDYIERAVSELGAKRVLFGSGGPHYDFHYELKRILYLNVSDSDRHLILYKNARRVLGLDLE